MYSEAVEGIIVIVVRAALERGVMRAYGYNDDGVCIQTTGVAPPLVL